MSQLSHEHDFSNLDLARGDCKSNVIPVLN